MRLSRTFRRQPQPFSPSKHDNDAGAKAAAFERERRRYTVETAHDGLGWDELRSKLVKARGEAPLFDTPSFVQGFEQVLVDLVTRTQYRDKDYIATPEEPQGVAATEKKKKKKKKKKRQQQQQQQQERKE